MTRSRLATATRPMAGLVAVLAAALVLAPLPARAADPALGPKLCGVLKKLLPAVKGYRPEGARAQLVMEVGEQFEYDRAKLRQVKAEIDRATGAGCPKEREAMLGIVKTKSLGEALD